MARSQSRSSFRDQPTPQSASAHKSVYNGSSPPRRRWTRSQSRELETGPGTNGGGRQNKGGESRKLGPIEESPANTPQRPSSSRVVPGSPEDAANMSGTTILPSEPETDLDPDMMIETLPSLEREAKGVLNILVPTSADPVSIVNTAKKLRDPQNPQRKRLKRFMSNLDAEAQYFGHQTYIDTKHVNQLLVTALAKKAVGTSRDWSPDTILYKANCARFALDVLLADASNAQKTDAQKKAIKDLEGRFPSPFMNGLGKERNGHGRSSLEKDTFDLALEIRTQSLLTRLEMHQNDSKFDPEAIVNGVFFDDVMADEEDSYQDAQAPLRGFNIGPFEDENGRLPERFTEAVHDRINEIRVTLAEEDDDVAAMIRGLQGIYRWQKFVLRVAQWVRKRDDEINRELESQPNAEDIREDFFQEDTAQHETSRLSVNASPARRTVALESTVQTVPVKGTPEQTVAQGSPAKPAKDKERRKSGKRQKAGEGSKDRRQTDFVRPVSEHPENPSIDNRRQTLPGPSAAPPEPREVPASPEGSPTLLQDEDIFADTNTHLQPPGEREHNPESSYSPPMPRRTPSVQPIEPATTGMPSSAEVWNTATSAITPRPNPEARKKTPATFIDRQEHAHRVSPISLDSRVERADQPQPSRKRTNRALEDTDSDDEFTRYERAIDPSSKRAQKPTDTQPRQHKRRRIDETGQPATEPQRGNTPPIPSPPAATAPARTTITTATRDNSPPPPRRPRLSQGFIPESGKVRSRWSPEEDSRLIRLIRECGTSWADLVRLNNAQPVREGEVRIDRDQVQYKDRARNLKIMYYREGRENELPGQFKYVTMSSRDKKSLQKRGIHVD